MLVRLGLVGAVPRLPPRLQRTCLLLSRRAERLPRRFRARMWSSSVVLQEELEEEAIGVTPMLLGGAAERGARPGEVLGLEALHRRQPQKRQRRQRTKCVQN